jgi:hypothetical protein
MAFCVPLWSKTLSLEDGGGGGVLVAQILLYLPRYKKIKLRGQLIYNGGGCFAYHLVAIVFQG